jgi:general secretion pathway protein D
MDNEEAKIVIGKNVPFITGSYAQAASTTGGAVSVNPFQTIERKDVGLTLKVKPQVAEGGTVKLQILQEVSSIQDTTNQAGIITNKRSIESTVLVDDGEIIVLGGLIQDDVQDGVDKVPGLGDIPILGSLFRYEKRKHVKTNLMVFLRPVVLRSSAASESLTGDRYDYIRNVQGKTQMGSHLFLPDIAAPQLPELKKKMDEPGKTNGAKEKE